MCITLTDIKDTILILSSLTTISLAFIGISKWKKEFKAKQNHESARLLIKTLYCLRDNLDSLRSNFMSVNEFMPGYNPLEPKERENYTYVFNNRMKVFQDSYSDFKSVLPEIEVTFGKKLRKKCGELNGQINSYNFSLTEFIQTADNKHKGEHILDLRKIVFRQSKNDKFRDEFVRIIESIEKDINKFMKI